MTWGGVLFRRPMGGKRAMSAPTAQCNKSKLTPKLLPPVGSLHRGIECQMYMRVNWGEEGDALTIGSTHGIGLSI